VDLHLSSATATEAERAAVDGLLGLPESRWTGGDREDPADANTSRTGAAVRARRTELLPVLHAVQKAIGWVSWGALNYVSLRLNVPPAETYGVASFYAMMSTEPQAGRVIHVCDDVVCRITGAQKIKSALRAELGDHPGPEGRCTFLDSPCLGLCERAPAVLVQRTGYEADVAIAPATPEHVPGLLGPVLTAPAYAEPVASIPQVATDPLAGLGQNPPARMWLAVGGSCGCSVGSVMWTRLRWIPIGAPAATRPLLGRWTWEPRRSATR
jgi:NADH-quinone oxidoreductase subunit F